MQRLDLTRELTDGEILSLIDDLILSDLKEEGLAGIEVYHSSHHIGQITKLRQWQKEYDLLATGGSDFHGTNKPDIEIGTGRGPLFVPDHLIDDLMN